MQELDEIKKIYGNKPPFKVPDNYFEQFTQNMMSQLPDKEARPEKVATLWMRMRPLIYLAAMFAIALFSVNWLTREHREGSSAKANITLTERDQDVQSASLAMTVDEYALCEYLSE